MKNADDYRWKENRKRARCPWCDYDPNSRWVSRKIFTSGSREARRALRRGRAVIISLPYGIWGGMTMDRVVCAHDCHTGRNW